MERTQGIRTQQGLDVGDLRQLLPNCQAQGGGQNDATDGRRCTKAEAASYSKSVQVASAQRTEDDSRSSEDEEAIYPMRLGHEMIDEDLLSANLLWPDAHTSNTTGHFD